MIERHVLDLREVDETQVAVVGGKAAHLGVLSRIEGIRVPAGSCVPTDAFRRIMADGPSIGYRLEQLSRPNPDDREAIRTLSAQIRRAIEEIAIPGDLAAAITRALTRLGERAAYAVRSSATAEDLPTASFAGQHDTYLNIVGSAAILQHVSRCWASLFTERAVTYRLRNRIAADTLTLSAPGNVTSQMGLALLDVADVIRAHPQVVAFLQGVRDDGFLDELPKFAGGTGARHAIETYLDRYGMRCVGEIDITRPRWRERPTTLVPVILDNVRNFEPGAAKRRFERGRQEARRKAQEVLERLHALPEGEHKADETKRMIDRVRTFIGYREYPKYDIVSRYFVYRRALLEEAERLVRANVLSEREDLFYLTFQELHDVVRSNRADDGLIRQRKDAFGSYHALTPPRVLTSDGEAIAGVYRRDDVPTGALLGLPVSAGTVEGRARVILDMAQADLEQGDILVTAHTDPSWTPLFVAITALVTEVGGLMTHGAVIAREYGLPAVVGVLDATRLIPDGQRIRVHGSDVYVEILP